MLRRRPLDRRSQSVREGTIVKIPRITAPPAAFDLIAEIRQDHPEILFHQSGGGCDGSSAMCYPTHDFRIGGGDVCLGEVGGVKGYIGGSQFEVWKHTQLILDVVDCRGGMFSLDNGRERRFLARSRVFTPDELALLEEAASG